MLTRHTIIHILTERGRLDEFIGNPNDFIATARRVIKGELEKIVVSDVEYEKIKGSVYELREHKYDSKDEAHRFLDLLYKVKTDFDYVLIDLASAERPFAQLPDTRDDSPVPQAPLLSLFYGRVRSIGAR